ncbi:FadR/GntR family transcriptional regulator [Prosthecomicrobium sp. N25]|uniref:FadR/GntR family transcriptional regulator n=1 Tax=Prosthecomicrobium sp. N25 TaxID=3129254 RepID=UPI0030773BD9
MQDGREIGGIGVVMQLRAYLAQAALPANGRLPPERDLASELGVSRAELRKALAALEAEGKLWRHVGKGTFLGNRPLDATTDVAGLVQRTNPAEVVKARLALEPEIARIAAVSATPGQIAQMRECLARAREAETWRQYEMWDNQFHRTIGEATQNTLLLGLLDTLSAVRRAVSWGRLRGERPRPPPDHHSFAEHEAVVAAIEDRDMNGAAASMRLHLLAVERNLLERPYFEDQQASSMPRTRAGGF